MTPQKTLTGRAWAELLLLSAIWGGSFLSVRLALNEIGPLTTVAHRVFWGALILWLVIAARRLPLPRDPRIWVGFLVMGALNNVIPFTLLTWGQLHIETGLTSILNSTTAIFGILVAAAVFADERLTIRRLIGVTLGFCGVAIAIGPEALMRFDLRSIAQLAVLGATLSYAFAGAWARARLSSLSPLVAAAGMLTASALFMVPMAWITEGAFRFDLSLVTWGSIAYIAGAATAVAYLLYYRVLAMAGSGNLMLCTLLIPPIAIVLGAAVLGEALMPQAYGGFVLLALGMVVLDGRALAALRGKKFF